MLVDYYHIYCDYELKAKKKPRVGGIAICRSVSVSVVKEDSK